MMTVATVVVVVVCFFAPLVRSTPEPTTTHPRACAYAVRLERSAVCRADVVYAEEEEEEEQRRITVRRADERAAGIRCCDDAALRAPSPRPTTEKEMKQYLKGAAARDFDYWTGTHNSIPAPRRYAAFDSCSSACEVVAFSDAEATCDAKGLRLCTNDEVLAGLDVEPKYWPSCEFAYAWTSDSVAECPTFAPSSEPTTTTPSTATPTVPPAPTSAPTDSECAVIADGNPDLDDAYACPELPDYYEKYDRLLVDPEKGRAGVACCDGTVGKTFCVYECQLVTLETAKEVCAHKGARLCSEAEVLTQKLVEKGGCKYDYTFVWTSGTEACPAPTTDGTQNCVIVVDGAPDNDLADACGPTSGTGLGVSDYDKPDAIAVRADEEAAGIRCCSDDDHSRGKSFCARDCQFFDYRTARGVCARHGMRLCTKEEILNNDVKGTGCQYDFTYVWSSSPGDGCPTSEPSTATELECVFVVDGDPTHDHADECPDSPDEGVDDVISAHVDAEVAGIRCCGDDGSVRSFCAYECQLFDFEAARSVCVHHGMRLCTKHEILGGTTKHSGCNYDYTYVWSADRAPDGTCGRL